MGTQFLFLIKTHSVLVNMGSLIVSASRKMVLIFFTYLFTLFHFSRLCLFRLLERYVAQKGNSSHVLIQSQEVCQSDANMIEEEKNEGFDDEHQQEEKSESCMNEGLGEEEDKSMSCLSFRFPTYDEFVENKGELINHDIAHIDDNDQVLSEDSGSNYLSHEVKEDMSNVSSTADNFVHLEGEIFGSDIRLENVSSQSDTSANSLDALSHVGNVRSQDSPSSEGLASERSPFSDSVGGDMDEIVGNLGVQNEEQESQTMKNPASSAYFPSDDESLVSDSESDSKSSFQSSLIDSLSDGFLSDIDFERAFELDTSMEFDMKEVESTKEGLAEQELEFQKLSKVYEIDHDYEDEDEEILEELKQLEESNLDPGKAANLESSADNKKVAEKPNSGEQLSSDSEEQNELERQWEHQDLVEQLKMEIKKVRAIGLPTILEESESPKIASDLKPWKIEEKFQREGAMDELHKFYKSYKERMRKLDILNYQKMYAIGFLRLKDPLQPFSRHKIQTRAMAAIISLDCLPCKSKSATRVHQPVMRRFSKELESDLEMVYVGQMCLSWEFLHWEYGKALELWDSDPHGIRQYNEVADKFQQFQVLLMRFIEDEQFHGPRVQHYVKSRCVLRNLLQVPVIKEDNLRDKRKERIIVNPKDAITSLKLVEIIEESIRIFWKFIRTDKYTSNAVFVKCRRGSNVELQNPADVNLLDRTRSNLQKKEKKLRELLRSENCILRKLQTHQEVSSDHVLYFFSQVDLRLVQRVLNMSKITTEQLLWCSDKLSKINFTRKTIAVEPSCLLFPCS